jgi:hexosaminidase
MRKQLIVLFFWISIFDLTLAQSPIIPAPVVFAEQEGINEIGNLISLNSDNLPEEIKGYFIDKLLNVFGIQVVVNTNSTKVVFKKINNTPPDYYTITISENILITYSSEASCFYAVNSLLQLIQGEKGAYYFNKCFIQDYPKFEWRGLHLDVSRHFYSVAEVKRFIDLMAMYKFNTFHWHLTDDQGWRIEIKKYPKLIEIGAWRDSTINDHYTTKPRTYTVEKYGGFYTQDQIKEVVEYAKNRFVSIVPEIEMPGHSRAALAAYPYYSCTGKQLEVPGLWGVFDEVFCAKEESIDFLKDILSEVIELFPSQYIHIGGDEAPKVRWKTCPRCQKVIRENGLKDEHELQSFFIREIDEFLTSKGRKLIGWDEILEGGLSPNAAVMSWRGFEGGIEAAKQEHYVVMTPGSHCYFDHYQSSNPNEPLAIGGFTPLEKVYDFNPIPEGFTEQQALYVLGGQANLWTEYIPDMKKLEYMTYPRALALSQALWCTAKPPFEEFKKSFVDYQLKYMNRYDVNFSKAFFYPKMELNQKLEGVNIHFKSGEPNYHFDLFVKSDEIHPSLSGGQVIGEKDSLYFERTTGSKVVNYSFKVSSEFTTEPSVFNFTVHPALELPIELKSKPSEKYSGSGSSTLVDGIIGCKPWKGNEWLGFQEQEIEFVVDLKKYSKIDSLEIGFLEDEGSWIHYPNFIRFSVSKKGKKWKYLKDSDLKLSSNDAKKGKTLPFSTIINKKGRYVKVLITTFDTIPQGMPGEGNIPWTFMDELIIFYK